MILVTGASGHFGSAVIKHLMSKGVSRDNIVALVRNEKKALPFLAEGIAVRYGDYDDVDSLYSAFKEVDTLVFVSGSDVMTRVAQHRRVMDAVLASGVKKVVYTSFSRKNETPTSPIWAVAEAHLATEKWLEESDVNFTVLRNNLYMDFVPHFIGPQAFDQGAVYLPAGQGAVSPALREEMAEAAAQVAVSNGHERKVYTLSNTEAYTYAQITEVLSGIAQKPLAYVSPEAAEYEQVLKGAGVPTEVIGILSGFAQAQAQGELDTVSLDLQLLIGRKPQSLPEYLKAVYAAQPAASSVH